MANQVFPTKGNLIATKKSLELAYLGYDLMDKKRNVLIKEMMSLLDAVSYTHLDVYKRQIDGSHCHRSYLNYYFNSF